MSQSTVRLVFALLLALSLSGCISVSGQIVPAANAAAGGNEAAPNTLSDSEKRAGWRLLFDGKTTQGWRNFKKASFPSQGWEIQDGCIKKAARVRGGDIITVDKFSDFDFRWEWRLPPRANSGVKYFILEERGGAVGHEYQLIDDSVVRKGKSSTASFYDVLPPSETKPLKAPGEWNQSRILVQGNHVEHWLNGAKVLAYELGSPAVLSAVVHSKFSKVDGFGTKTNGHILLTDHTDEAWFRNLKILDLSAAQGLSR